MILLSDDWEMKNEKKSFSNFSSGKMSSRTRYLRIAIQDDEVDGQFRLVANYLRLLILSITLSFLLPLEIIGVE